jgi:hypothetical protein
MFKYFESIDPTLETIIWAVLLALVAALMSAVIYKIIRADKIKAGPVEIVDEAAPGDESAPAVEEVKK